MIDRIQAKPMGTKDSNVMMQYFLGSTHNFNECHLFFQKIIEKCQQVKNWADQSAC